MKKANCLMLSLLIVFLVGCSSDNGGSGSGGNDGGSDNGGDNETYTLTMTMEPANGGAVIKNPEQANYAMDADINLIPVPENGYQFKQWTGSNGAEVTDNQIMMDDNKNITAVFEKSEYLLGAEDWEDTPDSVRQAGGFAWNGGESHKTQSDPFDSENSCLRFFYEGNPDLEADGWQEARFNFDKEQQELWIKYRVFIPQNWEYRLPIGGVNNKGFILLWAGNYGAEVEAYLKTAFWRLDDDTAVISCVTKKRNVPGSGGHARIDSDGRENIVGIGKDDRGKWMSIVLKCRISDKGEQNGELTIWKNGAVLGSWRNLDNASDDGNTVTGITNGYFFGYHNSGYTEDTTYLFDDMMFGTTASSIGFTIP